jgi:hypothetical protein
MRESGLFDHAGLDTIYKSRLKMDQSRNSRIASQVSLNGGPSSFNVKQEGAGASFKLNLLCQNALIYSSIHELGEISPIVAEPNTKIQWI